jgi:heme A synthase
MSRRRGPRSIGRMPSLRFRLLTALTAFAAWALVAVGGVVRVTESGLGCPHWPLCTANAVPLDQRASVIEYSHRAVVALVTVLVVAVAAWAWRTQRSRPDVLRPALLAVALVPLQAVLGAVAVWLTLPGWVVAFHFVVGLLFLAVVVLVAAAAWRRPQPAASPAFARLAWVSVLAGLALVSVGAAVVAVDAGTACGKQWPACNDGFAAGGGLAQLQVAHRMLAYSVAVLAVALLVLALRGRGPRLAGALPALAVLVQIGFGIGLVLAGHGRAEEILAGAHVAGAGAVWASLVALAALVRPAHRSARARAHALPAAAR